MTNEQNPIHDVHCFTTPFHRGKALIASWMKTTSPWLGTIFFWRPKKQCIFFFYDGSKSMRGFFRESQQRKAKNIKSSDDSLIFLWGGVLLGPMHPFVFYITRTYIGKHKWWEVFCFGFNPLITKRYLTNWILVIFKMEVIFSGLNMQTHKQLLVTKQRRKWAKLFKHCTVGQIQHNILRGLTSKTSSGVFNDHWVFAITVFTKKEEVTHACGSRIYSTPKRVDRAVK